MDVGSRAPDFTLPTPDGRQVRLSDLCATKTVVLFFYPKDETPGCTAEACGFRDAYDDFVRAGAEVVGVSSDDGASHQRFASKHGLPFLLLTDQGSAVRKQYEVKSSFLGLVQGRVTFVIDRGGVIRHRFVSQLQVGRHVQDALAVVRSLEQPATRLR